MFGLGALISKAVGWMLGEGLAVTIGVAATAGSMALSQSQAERAQSRSRKAAQGAAEAQAKAAARAQAVQNAPITAQQMGLVVKQREIGSLVEKFKEKESRGPTVYTLPAAEPTDWVTRTNQAIHKILTGAA